MEPASLTRIGRPITFTDSPWVVKRIFSGASLTLKLYLKHGDAVSEMYRCDMQDRMYVMMDMFASELTDGW